MILFCIFYVRTVREIITMFVWKKKIQNIPLRILILRVTDWWHVPIVTYIITQTLNFDWESIVDQILKKSN